MLLHQTDGDVAAVETLFQQELTRLVAHQTQVPEAAARPAPNWQVHDFVADCPLDLGARFIPQALTVTDLDQDGTAEVWLVYRTTCQGNVSPSTQKIILYEGPRKYAVRGTSRIALGGGQHDGGTYTLDAAWAAAPITFRQHAAQLWQQHRGERLSE